MFEFIGPKAFRQTYISDEMLRVPWMTCWRGHNWQTSPIMERTSAGGTLRLLKCLFNWHTSTGRIMLPLNVILSHIFGSLCMRILGKSGRAQLLNSSVRTKLKVDYIHLWLPLKPSPTSVNWCSNTGQVLVPVIICSACPDGADLMPLLNAFPRSSDAFYIILATS